MLEKILFHKKNNIGGRHKTALLFVDIQAVTQFILNFSDQHSVILLNALPCFEMTDVRILPSCERKHQYGTCISHRLYQIKVL